MKKNPTMADESAPWGPDGTDDQEPTCLRCRLYIPRPEDRMEADGVTLCNCVRPIPSTDGRIPDRHRPDWRQREYRAAVVSVTVEKMDTALPGQRIIHKILQSGGLFR